MATVNDVYQLMLKTGRKNQYGLLRRSDFQYFYNQAQSQYFNDLRGRFQRALLNAQQGTFNDETISTKLSPFTKINIPTTVTVGIATKPTNFIRLQAMRTVYGKPVQRIAPDKLANRLRSEIDPLTDIDPVYVDSAGVWQIFPTTVANINIDYLRQPQDVVWGFTTTNGREVYDSNTSKHPEWLDDDAKEIAMRALKLFGISIKDPELVSIGEQTNVKGE